MEDGTFLRAGFKPPRAFRSAVSLLQTGAGAWALTQIQNCSGACLEVNEWFHLMYSIITFVYFVLYCPEVCPFNTSNRLCACTQRAFLGPESHHGLHAIFLSLSITCPDTVNNSSESLCLQKTFTFSRIWPDLIISLASRNVTVHTILFQIVKAGKSKSERKTFLFSCPQR